MPSGSLSQAAKVDTDAFNVLTARKQGHASPGRTVIFRNDEALPSHVVELLKFTLAYATVF
jgi:hypothetical protein